MNPLLINQFFGLGDIIFVQGIVENLRKEREVVFPVAEEYAWVAEHLDRENVTFVPKSTVKVNYNSPHQTEDYLPLRFATQIVHGLGPYDYSHDYTVMEDKYTLAGIDICTWKDFEIKRNKDREAALLHELGIEGTGYCLVNGNFGSASVGKGFREIEVDHPKIVNLEVLGDYSMFDWIAVIERCDMVHSVDTSLIWLVDYLNLGQERFVYQRGNHINNAAIRSVLGEGWKYVR